jgi:hypothetical protein
MKISALPQLAAADVDGTVLVPVVKDDQTLKAPLTDLAAPMVTAAQQALADTRAVAATLPYPDYVSTADAQADATLLAGKRYTVVSGGQVLIYSKTSSTASSQIGVIPTATYTDRLKSKAMIPTVDLGAVGDGSHAAADQAGFVAAMAAIVASRNGLPTGTLDLFQFQNGIELEPGIYDAGGFTMTDCKSWLKARIPGTVFIRIPAGQNFLTVTGQLISLYWDGIVFLGGKGAFKATSTSANANQQIRFTNCYFGYYTECAISTNYSDNPFIKVDNCHFGGLNANAGIAIGGYVDQLAIENCAIGGNDYGIALGPRLSGNYNIVKNDLLQNRKADVWLKPNITESGTTNAGWAGAITFNKFGNEAQTSASPYPRILIANEDTTVGTDRASRTPLATVAGDTGKMVLPYIAHNRFAHISPWNAPIIRSYVSALSYGCWESNQFDGGQATYVIEWPNGRTSDYISNNSDYTFRESDGSVPAQFSTHPFGRLFDYAGYWPGDPSAVQVYAVSDNPTIAPVAVALAGTDLSYPSGTTAYTAADPYGTKDYASVTGMAVLSFTDPYAGAGGLVFIELQLGKAAANSLSFVTVDIFNYSDSSYALRRTVPLPASGKPGRLAIPVILPKSGNPASWQWRAYGSGVVSGSADTFVTGDWIMNTGGGRMGRDKALKVIPYSPRNKDLIGGARATLPTGWSIGTVNGMAGITATVVRVGVDQKGWFVELLYAGTCTTAGGINLYLEPLDALQISSGYKLRSILGVLLISGSFASANTRTGYDGSTGPCGLDMPCFSSADSNIQQLGVAFTPTTTLTRVGRTFNSSYFNANAAYVRPMFTMGFAVGASINAVVRLYTTLF